MILTKGRIAAATLAVSLIAPGIAMAADTATSPAPTAPAAVTPAPAAAPATPAAQELATPTPTQADLDNARKVMTTLKMVGNKTIPNAMVDGMIDRNAKMIPDKAEKIRALHDQLVTDVSAKVAEADENAVRIFAQHFTADDMAAIAGFLDSKPGRDYVNEMGPISLALQSNTKKVLGPAVQEMQARINDAADKKPMTGAMGAMGMTEDKSSKPLPPVPAGDVPAATQGKSP